MNRNLRKYFHDETELIDKYIDLLQEGNSPNQAAVIIAKEAGVSGNTIVSFLKSLDVYELDYERGYAQIRCANYTQYCNEDPSLIEGYEQAKQDNFQGWVIHHRLECAKYRDRSRTEWIERDEPVPRDWLKAFGLYYNRPAAELIFMRCEDHIRLHNSRPKPPFTEEHKQKMREAWERRKARGPVSEETKRKMSEARAKYWAEGHEEHRNKLKDRHVPHSEEIRKKISEGLKRRRNSE